MGVSFSFFSLFSLSYMCPCSLLAALLLRFFCTLFARKVDPRKGGGWGSDCCARRAVERQRAGVERSSSLLTGPSTTTAFAESNTPHHLKRISSFPFRRRWTWSSLRHPPDVLLELTFTSSLPLAPELNRRRPSSLLALARAIR